MQKVDKHISELLYGHDCVIVPELGGFVANYAPAKIHPVQHSFTPPSKNIVFNKNLKNNDGLLANQIVTTENKTYPEALKYIQHFVENANLQLKKGSKVKIDEVGTLFLDVERNIQFEPDTKTNHLPDAFGLAAFQSPAIKRDNISKRIEKEFKDRGAVPAERKKINVKRYVALAIAMPLIFAMVWIPLKTDLLKHINYASLNPFASKEVKTVTPDVPKNTTLVVIAPVKKDTAAMPANAAETLATTTTVEPVKPDTTRVVTAPPVNVDYKFHLVAGCFQIENNAVKFVASLQSQNIAASIIGQNDKGLFVVSCGDFATRKEANDQLEILRKSQPNAWLYKN
ncbi:MAG: hypothetical protein JWP12_778 [Bacteroidetes bacterium]|nr:hypothetical protein [Bacteroidota bacterium]